MAYTRQVVVFNATTPIRFELERNLNRMSHTRRHAATSQPVTPRDLRVLQVVISILINTRVYRMYALPHTIHVLRATDTTLSNDCY
jgi:hypothetical protein